MPFDTERSLQLISTYLGASGHVISAQIGEYKSAPDIPAAQLTAAVWMSSTNVVGLALDGGTIEVHVVMARLYGQAFGDEPEDVEITTGQAVQKIVSDLVGDADLGSEIRNVDVGGIHGTSVGAAWGHAEIDGAMYRIVDLTIPLIVDDSATVSL
jgi:hypothetical protein